MDYLSASVEIRNDCPSRKVEEATMAIDVRDVIWRQASALYAIQDLASCPWSSINLVWSHAAGLPVDYRLAFGLTRARPLALEPTVAKLSLGLPCFVLGPLQVRTFDNIECKYNLCLDDAFEPSVEELSVDLTRSIHRL